MFTAFPTSEITLGKRKTSVSSVKARLPERAWTREVVASAGVARHQTRTAERV